MKKLLTLLALIIASQMAFCQTYIDVINKFKNKPGVVYEEDSKSQMMQDVMPQYENLIKSIDYMKTLGLVDCNEAVRNDFIAQAKRMEKKCKKLIEEDNLVTLYIGKEEAAKAAIFVSYDTKECGMIVLEGKLSTSQIKTFYESFLQKKPKEEEFERFNEALALSSMPMLDDEEEDGLEGIDDRRIAPMAPPPASSGYDSEPAQVLDDKIYDVVERQPSFPGGNDSLMTWLGQNVNYPEEAQKKGIQGTVLVRFVVEKDGSIGDVKAVRVPKYYETIQAGDFEMKEEREATMLAEESVRVVRNMPKWIPGTQNDQPVRVKYTLPIAFRLQ